ncbi:FAD-binding oxidoreductase [Streptomyces sp. NBC_01387]|uniref:FAD-dependent oxidoreductase n=1 Tax=unclassified Streptomyces TaxID=2593676 RepID=UPI002252498C|nr:FAD-dependent oxidoreductase [Streptomyces sp. NBC_01500]MCX4553792.1 FAD-binding oxidoreductase [Streptomyces sp. NBC_01500]
MSSEVIVVGGGVIGLTTAIVLAEGGHPVRVWSRDPAGRTTSAVAGALWWPYRIEPEELVGRWSLESLREYEALAADPRRTGVRLVDGVHVGAGIAELGPWAAQLTGLREVAEGLRARLPLIDMPAHLGWLRRRLEAAGGRVEERTVTELAEVPSPVVVNCTGLGAHGLVPDPEVRPVRGQLVLVENPGIDEWCTVVDHTSSDTTYYFPQPGGLLLGGTAQEDDWNLRPDPATAEAIVARCARLRPEIADAKVLAHRVGLRPSRSAVRLEAERPARSLPGRVRPVPAGPGTPGTAPDDPPHRTPRTDPTGPSGQVLVHNYGHGGAGVTVAWGCARKAARLVDAGAAA